jgi:hypothetical protein
MEIDHLDLPEHLMELGQLTPSSVSKLLAAWDGLNDETKILVLSKLEKLHTTNYLIDKIRRTALDSENAYIRYLAARGFVFVDDSNEEELIIEKIENDPIPLVKFSLLEDNSAFSVIFDDTLNDPDLFFALPHEARLAKIRLVNGNGKGVAKLISHAVDKHLKEGTVSEVELYEILADYIVKPEFQERYSRETDDALDDFSDTNDIESLWGLVTILPEKISYILIKHLPEKSGYSTAIPETVIHSMTNYQLQNLLFRSDIKLQDLRKKLFWEAREGRDHVRSAAVSSNFQLKYDEFSRILAQPPKERSSTLKTLGFMASELQLCLYAAIHDALCASENSNDYEDAIYAHNHLEKRINTLKGLQQTKERTELRLYYLAKSVVPWDAKEGKDTLPNELSFLSEKIIPSDTWSTFMAFSEYWSKKPYNTKKLEKFLPQVYGPEENDEELIEAENDTKDEIISGLRSDLKVLDSKLNRQGALTYFVIGLIILILFIKK